MQRIRHNIVIARRAKRDEAIQAVLMLWIASLRLQ
jgi:hypothetical protein